MSSAGKTKVSLELRSGNLTNSHAAAALVDLGAIPGNRLEARYFGTAPQFWTNLQANYDLELAEDARGAEIADRIRPHHAV